MSKKHQIDVQKKSSVIMGLLLAQTREKIQNLSHPRGFIAQTA